MKLTYSFKILIMEAVFCYKKHIAPYIRAKSPLIMVNLMPIN